MGAVCVVVFPPFFDQVLGFAQGVEDLAIQEVIHCAAGACKACCPEGRNRGVKLSHGPFSPGLPDPMQAVLRRPP